MKISNLHKAIMSRDNVSLEEADDLIKEWAETVFHYGEDPETVLHDEGFEPDYVFDLLYHSR